MHVFQLESKTVSLHPPLYNFNAFSRQLQDTEMGSESSTANKNIWSCSRKDIKEHPRGQRRRENLLARRLSIFYWTHVQSSTVACCPSRWCLCTFREGIWYQINVRERLLVLVCVPGVGLPLSNQLSFLHQVWACMKPLMSYFWITAGWTREEPSCTSNRTFCCLHLFCSLIVWLSWNFLLCFWSEPKNWNHHWECAARENYEAQCNHNTLNVDLRDV